MIKMKGKQNPTAKLTLPEITCFDHVKNCPRYTSILNRPDGDGVGFEEIDSLQMELESILVDAMQRTKTLKLELMKLDSDGNVPEPTSAGTASGDTPKPKLHKSSTVAVMTPEKQNKKFKGNATTPKTKSLSSTKKKNDTNIVRNDIPDIFWKMVEPYCEEINDDDIKFLEQQIEISDQLQTYNQIHPLGKHYTLRWADEDIQNEIKESARLTNGLKRKLPSSSSSNATQSKQITGLLDESKKLISTNESDNSQQYGPLTQRLISALIEQNLMTPFDIDGNLNSGGGLNVNSIDMPKGQHMSPKTLSKQFNILPPSSSATTATATSSSSSSSNSLEKKIKKELIEHGILDMDEASTANTNSDKDNENNANSSSSVNIKDDEILNEINSLHESLKLVSAKCKQTQMQLLNCAKQSMQQQKVKKKINLIDEEIKELFNKNQTLKKAQKQLPKKDKDKLQKLIKDRETLHLEYESLAVHLI